MAQYIKQPSLWGRIGTGIGKGLAEQLPEEIQRGRLAAGLKKLGEQKDLTPFQQFSGLISQPGITPQGIQTGGELLRQQAYLNALKNQYQGQGEITANEGSGSSQPQQPDSRGYVPTQEEFNQPIKGEIPTLATPEDTAESYKTYIPPTEQQERQDAFENFNKNPARYNYDFENALAERKAITARNQQIQQAHNTQEKIAVAKEETVKNAFDKEVAKLGIIPTGENPNFDPKLYQIFEEKLLKSVLSKKEGGEGLSQEQAIKTYSDQLLNAYKNYTDLSTLSVWSPKDFNRRVDAIVKNLEPFGIDGKKVIMDKLIADYGNSPLYAAHKAFPIKQGEVPTIHKGGAMTDVSYSKLKKEMGDNFSPLSIAYELQRNHHDPRAWLNYLNKNRDNLQVWQADQLTKNINLWDLKDMWLQTWEER